MEKRRQAAAADCGVAAICRSAERGEAAGGASSGNGSHAAHDHAEGVHGWIAGVAHGGDERALSDDPGNSGIPRYTQDKLNAMAVERAKAGFQLGFHAIGDRAVEMALDAFALAEAATKAGPIPPQVVTPIAGRSFVLHGHDLRFRIEHSQVVSAGRFRALQAAGRDCVDAAESSANRYGVGGAAAGAGAGEVCVRVEVVSGCGRAAGVWDRLSGGADYAVSRGVCGVTRMNEAGTMSFHPEQKLTIGQTLYAYTQGSAYAEFAEGWKGKLAPGLRCGFCGAGPGSDGRCAARDSGDEGAADGGGRKNGVPAATNGAFRRTAGSTV